MDRSSSKPPASLTEQRLSNSSKINPQKEEEIGMHLGSEKLLIDRQTNEESTEEKSCTKPSDMVHPHLLINYVSSNIVPLYIINI